MILCCVAQSRCEIHRIPENSGGLWSMRVFSLSTILRAGTVALGLANVSVPAGAESVLTIGMTAGDIPLTTGNPDQGFERFPFVGFNLYDGLAISDLSRSDA